MIELDVKDYCHKCELFKPKIDKEFSHDDYDNVVHHQITITCKKKWLCEYLSEYFESIAKRGEND